jgi:hypothetical protein
MQINIWDAFSKLRIIGGLLLAFLTLRKIVIDHVKARKVVNMRNRILSKHWKSYEKFKKLYESLPTAAIDKGNPKSLLLGLQFGAPILENEGEMSLPESLIEKSEKIARSLRPNEETGFLDVEPDKIDWRASPLTLPYRHHRYSTFLASLKSDFVLRPITAGALICCSDRNSVVYIKRSDKLHTFPSHYHHFGGGYKAQAGFEPGDRDNLFETARREIEEENNIDIAYERFGLASLLIEGGTNYVQYLFLGVDVSEDERSQMKPSPEGQLVDFPFDELADRMSNEPFVPTCLLQTMIWLSLGAPTSSNRQFSKRMARKQFSELSMRYLRISPDSQRIARL